MRSKVAPPIASGLLCALAGLGLLTSCAGDDEAEVPPPSTASAERQEAVAERGAHVMGFDLEATTHVFTPTDDGGLQEVVADDPEDAEQVVLIRLHLLEEQARFAGGDFDDPAAIHGDDMPGLAALRADHDAVEVTYAEHPDGASLRYATEDLALVGALHDWFEAQLMDHGAHAHAG